MSDAIYSRTLDDFERGAFDRESGRFPMTLATDGEASDGHILAIDGAQMPERMPLLLSHENHPTSIMGSVIEATPSGRKLRATGVLNLEDDGTWMAETRQGIATLVACGDLRAVSVRWRGIKEVPRTALKPDHPAYVSPDERDYVKRSGVYFEKWAGLEGSLVAIGADPKALIGRAEACARDESRSFFRELAARCEAERERPPEPKLVEVVGGILIPAALRDSLIEEARHLARDAATANADAITDIVAEMLRDAIDSIREQVAPAPAPAREPVPAVPQGPPRVADLPADALAEMIGRAIATHVNVAVRRVTGRVSK